MDAVKHPTMSRTAPLPQQRMIQPKRWATPKMTNCSSHICAGRLNLWTQRSFLLLFSVTEYVLQWPVCLTASAVTLLSTPRFVLNTLEQDHRAWEKGTWMWVSGWRTRLHPWTHSNGPSHSETTCLGADYYFHFKCLCQILKSICVLRCVESPSWASIWMSDVS